jgi:hypothetical protein
MGVGEGL